MVQILRPGIDYIGVGVGALIFNSRGHMLMGLRGPKAKNERLHWEVPGGSIEFMESRTDAVMREVLEEIGVRIRVLAELRTVDHMIPAHNNLPAEHWLATPFLVELLPGETPRIMEPDKYLQLDWFPLDGLPEPLALTTSSNIQAYRAYLHDCGQL